SRARGHLTESLVRNWVDRSSRILRIALLALVGACGSDPTHGDPEPTPPPPPSVSGFRLSVGRMPGISGLPADGNDSVTAGSTVSYSFTLDAGYENLRVQIDGEPAPVVGQIVMDRDHSLLALSDKSVVVPPGLANEVQAVAGALSSTIAGTLAPMEAVRTVNANVQALASKVSPDSLAHLLRIARVLASKPSDAAKLARVLREIGDSLQREQVAGAQQTASASRGAPEIVFLFVNGVNTTLERDSTTVDRFLRPRIQGGGYGDRLRVE